MLWKVHLFAYQSGIELFQFTLLAALAIFLISIPLVHSLASLASLYK